MEFKLKLKFVGEKDPLIGRYFKINGQYHKGIEYAGEDDSTLIAMSKNSWNQRITRQYFGRRNLLALLNNMANTSYQWVTDIKEVPDNLRKYKLKKSKDVQAKT